MYTMYFMETKLIHGTEVGLKIDLYTSFYSGLKFIFRFQLGIVESRKAETSSEIFVASSHDGCMYP